METLSLCGGYMGEKCPFYLLIVQLSCFIYLFISCHNCLIELTWWNVVGDRCSLVFSFEVVYSLSNNCTLLPFIRRLESDCSCIVFAILITIHEWHKLGELFVLDNLFYKHPLLRSWVINSSYQSMCGLLGKILGFTMVRLCNYP